MINSIIESISISLNAEFGDEYTTYTESVEQGLNEPCFFVFCINPTDRLFLGKRYFRENQFCLQYFPADKDRAKEEVIVVGNGGFHRWRSLSSFQQKRKMKQSPRRASN